MKKFLRVISLLLVFATLTGLISGCSKIDSSTAYLTKGEFMLLFTDETGISASSQPNIELNLNKASKYYDSAIALVEIGYMTSEDAVTDLDEPVTKELVATLCTNNLIFRKNFDIKLKDENKLKDSQACKDAVGHGIVSDDNGYFVAYYKMTYDECQFAIDRMMEIDANSSFEGTGEVDVKLKNDVINITDELDDEALQVLDPSDEGFNQIIENFSSVQNVSYNYQENNDITLLSTNEKPTIIPLGINSSSKTTSATNIKPMAKDKNYCSIDEAEADDNVVVRIRKDRIQRVFKVGEMLVYGLWAGDRYNQAALKDYRYAFCGEVLSVSEDYFYHFYSIRIASEKEILDSAKLNQYNSKNNGVEWKSEQLKSEHEGLKIDNFVFENNSLSFTVNETVTNDVNSWRDAKFDVDLKYEFAINNISLDVTGFGDVLKGNIKNAVCKLNYTVVNDFNATTKLRVTPDNNRNGKFLNNLSRSRLTGANAAGATSIKIARIYADIGHGFNVEMYVYLTVEIDGSIHIKVQNTYGRGFKIINNKPQVIADKDTNALDEINVNVEAGVHFDFSLRWLRHKGSPWADVDLEVGLGLDCTSKVFVLDETHTTCNAVHHGYVSNDELIVIKQNADIDFCFDGNIYAYYEISGLNKDTKIGKVIRFFDEDFSFKKRDKWIITSWHYEDGGKVSSCSREYKGLEDAEVTKSDEETFELSTYKVVIPEYTCGLVRITEYPVDKKDLKNMGGIKVTVKNQKVATAHIHDNQIVIEAVGAGATELILETKNKRFKQECSITVTKND